MKITKQKNDAPTMPKCEMLCDGGLNPKLDNYEGTKFLNKHSTNLYESKSPCIPLNTFALLWAFLL